MLTNIYQKQFKILSRKKILFTVHLNNYKKLLLTKHKFLAIYTTNEHCEALKKFKQLEIPRFSI